MEIVKGQDVLLYVYRGGSPVLTACITDCVMMLEQETINIATADTTGFGNDYIAGYEEVEITASGVFTFNDPSFYGFDEFIANRRTSQRIVLEFTDKVGNTITYDMYVLLRSAEVSGNVDDFSLFDLSLVRCGGWTVTKTVGGVVTVNRIITEGGDGILLETGDDILTE